jgi:hypothetical protein
LPHTFSKGDNLKCSNQVLLFSFWLALPPFTTFGYSTTRAAIATAPLSGRSGPHCQDLNESRKLNTNSFVCYRNYCGKELRIYGGIETATEPIGYYFGGKTTKHMTPQEFYNKYIAFA